MELTQDHIQWRSLPCSVEPSGSATRELISEMDLRKIRCEDGRWM
jgi:hypothetical protein